tara:strand:- start:95 stop:334 length:240 start_codon:yes stop_codon:yes gene_type:complete
VKSQRHLATQEPSKLMLVPELIIPPEAAHKGSQLIRAFTNQQQANHLAAMTIQSRDLAIGLLLTRAGYRLQAHRFMPEQ